MLFKKKKNFKSIHNYPKQRGEEIEMHCIKAFNWIELNLCIVSFVFAKNKQIWLTKEPANQFFFFLRSLFKKKLLWNYFNKTSNLDLWLNLGTESNNL